MVLQAYCTWCIDDPLHIQIDKKYKALDEYFHSIWSEYWMWPYLILYQLIAFIPLCSRNMLRSPYFMFTELAAACLS